MSRRCIFQSSTSNIILRWIVVFAIAIISIDNNEFLANGFLTTKCAPRRKITKNCTARRRTLMLHREKQINADYFEYERRRRRMPFTRSTSQRYFVRSDRTSIIHGKTSTCMASSNDNDNVGNTNGRNKDSEDDDFEIDDFYKNYNFEDDDDDDDDDQRTIQSRERLQSAFSDMFRIGTKEDNFGRDDIENQQIKAEERQQTNLQQAQRIMQQQQQEDYIDNESQSTIMSEKGAEENELTNYEYGDVLLSADDYIQARDRLNSDGSLAPKSSPSVEIDETYKTDFTDQNEEFQKLTESILMEQVSDSSDEEESTLFTDVSTSGNVVKNADLTNLSFEDQMEILEDTLKQNEEKRNNQKKLTSSSAEELHKQVFANEEAYLKQREDRRKSKDDGISNTYDETPLTSIQEAMAFTRNAQYEQERNEQYKNLEREIADFEKNILGKLPKKMPNRGEGTIDANTSSTACVRCGCGLSDNDIQHYTETHSDRNNTTRASNQGPLCLVCYADVLKEQQQERFPRRSQAPYQKRPPLGNRFSSSPPRTQQQQQPNQLDDNLRIRRLTKSIRMLENDVQRYKRKAELAEQEIYRLQKTISEMEVDLRRALDSSVEADSAPSDNEVAYHTDETPNNVTSPWAEVVDPDTGDVFYWNEETEEMKWEL